MLTRINTARAAHGLPPLRENVQLGQAAKKHAGDLASSPWLIDTGQWHTGSDGSSIIDRIRREGYQATRWREVVGWGFNGDSNAMFNWWMNSPVHKATILSGDVDEAGVGYLYAPGAPWGSYWTIDFGKRANAPEPARPYTSHVPIVTTPSTLEVDLANYLRGDGRSYRVGNSRGSFEVFQTQTEGDRFYQVKAWDDLSQVHWEEFSIYDEMFIRRDVDTSPGGGRFYRQFDAPWVWRYMAVGEVCTQGKRVQFYTIDGCHPINEPPTGDVIDTIKFVAHHKQYTFPARDWPAVTLDDVVELEWVQGGESYFYARHFGLVGWARKHSDPNSPQWSAISEMRPDVGKLQRLSIGCLE